MRRLGGLLGLWLDLVLGSAPIRTGWTPRLGSHACAAPLSTAVSTGLAGSWGMARFSGVLVLNAPRPQLKSKQEISVPAAVTGQNHPGEPASPFCGSRLWNRA